MSLSTLQLASTSALALLAGSAEAIQGASVVLDESALSPQSACATPLRVSVSRMVGQCAVGGGDDLAGQRLFLDLAWNTKPTVSDVLTDLLDVDGIRVVADRHLWDRPDTLALRHDFDSDME